MNETLQDLLSLIDVSVELEEIETWTQEQNEQVEKWAAANHLKASDNSYVHIPDRPDCLPIV